MKKIFFSYAYEDFFARRIMHFLCKSFTYLETEDIDISDSPKYGENWQAGITDEINNCSIFICFVDRNNPNVMFELGYALAKNKKIILVGDFQDLPNDVRSMTYVSKEAHPVELLKHVEHYLIHHDSNILTSSIEIHRPQHTIKNLLENPELLDTLVERELEELVKNWFTTKGYMVECTKKNHYVGYDLLIQPFMGTRAAVEIKKYKKISQVPLTVIRSLESAIALNHIPYGVIISTAPFTRSAEFYVQNINSRSANILLWTLKDLARMDEIPGKSVDDYILRSGGKD